MLPRRVGSVMLAVGAPRCRSRVISRPAVTALVDRAVREKPDGVFYVINFVPVLTSALLGWVVAGTMYHDQRRQTLGWGVPFSG